MGKVILINLFKTFIFSVIISIAALSIFHAVKKTGNFSEALPLIGVGALSLNGILLIMACPAWFLTNPSVWKNPAFRLFLYFGGPLAFILTNFSLPLNETGTIVNIITGCIFFIIHAIFYYKLLQGPK
ncbi:MAG: hypothetical protein ABIN13_13945 [Mucilaginibacter sp.]